MMQIELRRLTKRFGRTTALADVDLTIASGAKVALLGPNGSGKTTLTRALMGLIHYEGDLLIDGQRVTDRMTVAPRIAYVPQITPQMAATVAEVVAAVGELRGVRPDAVSEVAADLGLDVPAVAGRALRNLSGGMRQKLLLALALACPVDLLVLDEPTASLDAAARARFFERFARASAAATVILCSHRLDELRALIDHVVVLADGRVVHDGPAAGYLAGRLAGLIELRYRGHDPSWLVEHGFARATGDWWTRAVSPADKVTLVPAVLAALPGSIDDLIVRDTDRLELEERHAA